MHKANDGQSMSGADIQRAGHPRTPAPPARCVRQPRATAPHWIAVGSLCLCAVAGVAAARVPPAIIAVVLMLGLVALAAWWVVGLTGTLVMAPTFLSFFLLNRFDQGYALPVGDCLVKVNYWFAGIVLVLLALVNVLRPSRETLANRRLVRFAVYFGFGLSLFAVLGLLSIVLNGVFDRYVPDRSALGELLALGSLCLPMVLLFTIVLSDLSKQQTLMCLRGLIVFAAGTGFVMVVFGLLPQTVTSMLGWSRELVQGSGGLVRGQTPLGHPNSVAGILVLFLPVTVILGLRHRSLIWTPFYLGSALFLMGGVLFSMSRAAAAVAVVVLFLSVLYILGAQAWKHMLSLGAAGVFIAVVVWAGLSLLGAYDFSRFWSRRYHENASIERRIETMTTALRVWRDHPILGASPNSVYPRDEIKPDWEPAAIDDISTIIFYRGHISAVNPHNLYLTILAEYGVLGGGVFFALLGFVLLTLWRAWRVPVAMSPLDRTTAAALFIAVVGFMGISMGGALYTYLIRLGLVFWTFVALALRYSLLAAHNDNEAAAERM